MSASVSTDAVLKEEDSTEEAEQVGGEQGQVDGGGAAQLHHHRHEAVQAVHAQGVAGEQEPWRQRGGDVSVSGSRLLFVCVGERTDPLASSTG